MSVSGIGSASMLTLQAIGQMRDQLDDLQRQLGSGQKSTTYAGLGLDRGLTVGLRSQLNAVSGYQETISQAGVRLDLMQTALTQFSSVTQQAQSAVLQSQYVLAGGTQTQDQKNTATTLDSLVGMLNTAADGRYLFSGSTVDQEPVVNADKILNGDGLKAGLIQIISERKQADLGASGLGRVAAGAFGSAGVSLTDDASPFGFKLVGATTAMTGAVVNPPSGSPQSMSVDLSGASPVAGDTIKFTFTLPDGTSRDLTLTATNASPAGAGQFTIGGTPTATATSLQNAITQGLGNLANTELVAASAVAAGNDFFNTDASNPPQRVAGPPFDTATALVDGTADTVAWYQGDNATTDPRSTALARADQSLTVSYGARANEQGLRTAMQSLAVFAATKFSSADPNGEAQYAALRQRIGLTLSGSPSQQRVPDISAELAGAQVALNNANDRHKQTDTTLQNLLQSIQGVPQEQVAAQIMSLQTSLQATLQTTAMLLKTSILNYL
jgi:flagellin-like hook-associated protein FlgL